MKRAVIMLVIMLFPLAAAAQTPVTGFPPYGSFADGNFDAINRQNLNVNSAIPVMSSPGRGMDLNFAVVYDSLVYRRVTVGPNTSWQFSGGWKQDFSVGLDSGSGQFKYCSTDGLDTTRLYNWAYTDPSRTRHPFTLDFHEEATACHYNTGPRTGYATDGSGYYLDVTDPDNAVVWSPSGLKITPDNVPDFYTGGRKLTDTNGNFLSRGSGGTNITVWTDTAGRQTLKIDKSVTNRIDYRVLDASGAYQTITLNLQTFNIKSNFSCSGITEYTGTASLPTSLVLPSGQSYTFTYEDTPSTPGYKTGRLKRATLPTGGYYEYQYPASPNNGINCADGNVNSMTRVISTDGVSTVSWQYTRDPAALKTTITAPQLPCDTAANQSVFTFNASGQQLSQKIYQGSEATGTLLRTVNSTWAPNGTPTSTTAILEDGSTQAKIETDFDTSGNLLELREYAWGTGAPGSLVRKSTNTYTTIGFIQDRLSGQVISDGLGGIKSRVDIAYDGSTFSGPNCITGAAQHDDTNYACTFTARGNPRSVTRYTDPVTPGGGITKNFTYDSLGNLRTADLNCCNQKQWNFSATTQYAYPDSVVRGPVGNQLITSATYNFFTGLLATTTDENGRVTTFVSYDVLKRLTDLQRPDNTHILYTYDDVARTVRVETPVQGTDKLRQTTYFDGLGRPFKTTIADASNNSYSTTEVQYDPMGRPYKTSNPHNSTAQYWTETDFDALGRVKKTIAPAPDSSQSSYSYSGTAVTVTDPTGKQRKLDYDALGRLLNVYEPDVNSGNALTQQTSYTYTVLDALATVTQGVQTRTYSYDALGRLTSVATPETTQIATTYQYNDFDLVTQRTDPRGAITTYGYDMLNRLQQITYNVGSTGVPATPSVSFTYGTDSTQNNKGRLLTMTDGVGSEIYSYDILGQVTQIQKVISGTTYTTSYAYNLANELSSITYPSGRVVEQAYDAIGRLCRVGGTGSTSCTATSPFASGFGYNTAFQVTGVSYGNGVAAALGYSADRLQLTSLTYTKSPTTLLSLSYGYTQNGGNNGQIASITDNTGTQEAGRSVTYTYDALYRLSTAVTTGSTSYPKWGLSWTYDRYGNRLNQTQTFDAPPPNSVAVSATTNRITDPGYSYDANGNMTQDGLNALTYDAENRAVTSATGGTTTTYTYDGSSLRVKKQVGAGTAAVYVFSGSKVIAEYAAGAPVTSPQREYIYSGSQLVATIEGSTTKYHHNDHLSLRVTTDTNGVKIADSGHYPYGENWYETGGANKLKFTSYARDIGTGESGNDYAMMRSYVNRLARFSSTDPLAGSIGDPQSLNRNTYVLNDAVNRHDPLGLVSKEIMGELVVFGLGGGGGLGGGNCTVDGASTPCHLVDRLLETGVGVPCPNNDCRPQYIHGEWRPFSASTNGMGAYFPNSRPGTRFASNDEALAAAAEWAQAESVDKGYEHCGMTYGDSSGRYSFTSSVEGSLAGCQPLLAMSSIPVDATLTGAYHGHGRNDPGYANERFSGQMGDCSFSGLCGDRGWAILFGYPLSLATPGGRVMIYYPEPNCQRFLQGNPAGTGTTIPVCQ